MTKLPQPTEHQIQRAIVLWAKLNAPRYGELDMLFAIPNGGFRHIGTAMKLKAEGVRSGVPDLFLAVPSTGIHGLFLEVKRGKSGQVSRTQAEWRAQLAHYGYAVSIVRSVDEGISRLKSYLNIKQ